MGNKSNNDRINKPQNKNNLNPDKGDITFFDDNNTNKVNNKNIEYNPLVSQYKSDPFIEYEVVKDLGKGSYAIVRLIRHKLTGAIRAMKVIKRIENDLYESHIKNEVNILMKLDHPNIVKIFELYVSDLKYYLITEYCSGGSLFKLINQNNGPFTEIQTSYIMHQLFSVVNYCHKMKIIHRDLKPENILINKNDNG